MEKYQKGTENQKRETIANEGERKKIELFTDLRKITLLLQMQIIYTLMWKVFILHKSHMEVSWILLMKKKKKNEAKSQTPRVKDVKEIKTTNEVVP